MIKQFFLLGILLSNIAFCTAMDTDNSTLKPPASGKLIRSNSYDSPRRVRYSADLEEKATFFLTSLNQSTFQKQAALIAQLEAACKAGQHENAKKLFDELEVAHAWNLKNWNLSESDYANAMEQYEALRSKHPPIKKEDNTTPLPEQSPSLAPPDNGRRRSFSLKTAATFLRRSSNPDQK